MLNEVHVEGVVTRAWTYQRTRFARIACRMDAGRVMVMEANRRPSEYLTLRFEHPLALAAEVLRPGSVVRAAGYLSSRDYEVSLSSFSQSAQGDATPLTLLRNLAEQLGDQSAQVVRQHVLNEVVVERFELLARDETGSGDGNKNRRRRRDERKAQVQVPVPEAPAPEPPPAEEPKPKRAKKTREPETVAPEASVG